MVLQSGLPPYDYPTSHPFRAGKHQEGGTPVGISGVLIEDAQFVITAEIRRWGKLSSPSALEDFNLYVNPVIAASGRYEPKTDGSTLGNEVYPGGAVFIDPILETRVALENMWSFYEDDTEYDDQEHKASWLQAAYPDSASGYYDDGTNLGHFLHRSPSATGKILDMSLEVLGTSGVLYDIDVGEIMFNPYPHISSYFQGTAHGEAFNGAEDTFSITLFPCFPGFQTTNGSIITETGREPVQLENNTSYETRHISSGVVRTDGYVLKPNTEFILGRGLYGFFGVAPSLTVASEGLRTTGQAGTLDTGRVFLNPGSKGSGVYRLLPVNRKSDYPTTTVESGLISPWPKLENTWPSPGNPNSTIGRFNLGFHVYDDAIWITDRNWDASFGGPNFGYPSGLAVMSPYTAHRHWVRYAEIVNDTQGTNWASQVGLERTAANSIVRMSPSIKKDFTTVSGRLVISTYSDSLGYVSETITTSNTALPVNANDFWLGGDTDSVSDFFLDSTASQYWVFNNEFVGADMWRFDSSWLFDGAFIAEAPGQTGFTDGIRRGRGCHVNSKNFVFYGFEGGGPIQLQPQSGIHEFTIDMEPPTLGSQTPGEISFTTKIPRMEHIFGNASFAEINDIFEVTGGTHVPDGIYMIIRLKSGSSPFNGGDLYLMEIEEGASEWNVKAHYLLDTSVGTFAPHVEMLHKDID